MASRKTYIEDIADKVAERNNLEVIDKDAYMDAVVIALVELTSQRMRLLDLEDKKVVKRG